jgi:hypothetical protein
VPLETGGSDSGGTGVFHSRLPRSKHPFLDTGRLAALTIRVLLQSSQVLRQAPGRHAAIDSSPVALGAISLPKLLLTTIQLALIAGFFATFRVQGVGLVRLLQLVVPGFFVHALLPAKHRLRFFIGLSIAGLWWSLGWMAAAVVVGLASLLISAALIPTRTAVRVTLVVMIGAALAYVHITVIEWSSGDLRRTMWVAIPVVGSMFMFRMAVCLHELAHATAKTRPTLEQVVAYFLLLPNVCFPLFPVVDLRTMMKGYYDTSAEKIYRDGLRWMFTGALHLIGYRFVIEYISIDTDAVVTSTDRLRYVFSPYLCYLQVSGQFHIAVGILHLFGFNLPRTHHNFYLASSFTDLWRRINIYFTSFMQKLFFMPISFALRRRGFGPSAILAIGTGLVFVGSWALHPYQTFWIRRKFPLTAQDALFWAIIAIGVVVTAVYDQRKAQNKLLRKSRRTVNEWLRHGLSVAATFTAMSVLWSLWSSDSVGDWFSIVTGR